MNRKDSEAYGEERTRRLVLEAYDEMAVATASGEPFKSSLTPPPPGRGLATTNQARKDERFNQVVRIPVRTNVSGPDELDDGMPQVTPPLANAQGVLNPRN